MFTQSDMRNFLLILFSNLFLGIVFSQQHATWSIQYNKADSAITIDVQIARGWHIYSQHIDPMAGPIPTSFLFMLVGDVELNGDVIEPQPIVHFDEAFGSELMYFENEVEFKQKIILTSQANLSVDVNYMMCNDTMCLPPTNEKLTIALEP